MLEKPLAITLLLLNGVVQVDNFILADPSKWREAIEFSTSPNSEALYTFRFQAATPATTVGNVWDVRSRAVPGS